ncbi:MAG TPA: HAMP domain-containing sensor histidine kinase [Marmoricola sp.]|nr:HAMP domain-containing sensor histidine kinase [Marmoricola sp.]
MSGRTVRLGLRARLALLQGLLALLICGAITAVVWAVSAHVLVDRHRAVVTARALSGAQALATGLEQPGAAAPRELLERVNRPDSVLLVLWHEGRWSTTSERDLHALQPTLASLVRSGSPRSARIDVLGEDMRVVGVALPHAAGYYFELAPTTDVDGTVRLLGLTFTAGTIAVALVAAALGWLAGNRALRPLAVFSRAAAAAAAGEPHARLDAEDDPDLGQLARSFNSTTEALRQRVQADARFAADVSHELRTPLTTMLNSMDVIEAQRDRLPERAREAAELLDAELQRFQQLVLDLLEISRAEGDQHPRLEPTAVAEAVRVAADAAAGRPVTRVEPDAEGVVLALDRRRIERIVGNLVRNADQHGGGCTAVHVVAEPESVKIVVDDAGPGIPPDRRERVLERFVSTATGPTGGSGLGLSIVQVHVRAHQGRLRLTERPGGGTRAVVTLPCRASV